MSRSGTGFKLYSRHRLLQPTPTNPFAAYPALTLSPTSSPTSAVCRRQHQPQRPHPQGYVGRCCWKFRPRWTQQAGVAGAADDARRGAFSAL